MIEIDSIADRPNKKDSRPEAQALARKEPTQAFTGCTPSRHVYSQMSAKYDLMSII